MILTCDRNWFYV